MMCQQQQPAIDSRMACISLLGITCIMYAVNSNVCNCYTMLVCPGRQLLYVTYTLLLCQLWYLLVEETTTLSEAMEAYGPHLWLFWFNWSFGSVCSCNVSPCFQCFVLLVDPNIFVSWDYHQGVGHVHHCNNQLTVNE